MVVVVIKACPRCGSQDLVMGQLKAGEIYGVTSWKLQCQNCGYQGQPLIFDSRKEYGKFLEALGRSDASPIADTEEAGEEPPDERIVDLLRNTKDEKRVSVLSEKSWRTETVVSMIIAAFIVFIVAPASFELFGGLLGVLYLVFFFVLVTVVVLVVFIIVEYAVRKMAREPVQK